MEQILNLENGLEIHMHSVAFYDTDTSTKFESETDQTQNKKYSKSSDVNYVSRRLID